MLKSILFIGSSAVVGVGGIYAIRNIYQVDTPDWAGWRRNMKALQGEVEKIKTPSDGQTNNNENALKIKNLIETALNWLKKNVSGDFLYKKFKEIWIQEMQYDDADFLKHKFFPSNVVWNYYQYYSELMNVIHEILKKLEVENNQDSSQGSNENKNEKFKFIYSNLKLLGYELNEEGKIKK